MIDPPLAYEQADGDDHPDVAHDEALRGIMTFYQLHLGGWLDWAGRSLGAYRFHQAGTTPDYEEYASEVLYRLLRALAEAREDRDLAAIRDIRAKALRSSYWRQAIRNGFLDARRRLPTDLPAGSALADPAVEADPLIHRDVPDPHASPESVLEQDETDALIAEGEFAAAVHGPTSARVRLALAERGRRPSRPRTHWDGLAVDLFNYHFPHDLDDPEHEPERGGQARIAEVHGVSRAAVHHRQARTRPAFLEAYYVVVVLGRTDTFYNLRAVHEHLDMYDRIRTSARPQVLNPADRSTLETAAPAVDQAISRVDPARYAHDDFRLHDSEACYADLVDNPTPRCVLQCSRHAGRG